MTVVFGTLGVVLGMLLFSPLLAVFSGFVMIAGWTWVYRRSRRGGRSRTG
jgi:cbb3-type cytochrome oxidase subunit 3